MKFSLQLNKNVLTAKDSNANPEIENTNKMLVANLDQIKTVLVQIAESTENNIDNIVTENVDAPYDKIFSNYDKFDQEEIKYWKDLYGLQPELIERVVVDRMLVAANLEKNPVNTTKCLNKLFKAQYAGYVENPYYDRHAYTFNFYDYNYEE